MFLARIMATLFSKYVPLLFMYIVCGVGFYVYFLFYYLIKIVFILFL